MTTLEVLSGPEDPRRKRTMDGNLKIHLYVHFSHVYIQSLHNAILYFRIYSNLPTKPLPSPLLSLLKSAIFLVFSSLLLTLASTIAFLSSALAWYARLDFFVPPIFTLPLLFSLERLGVVTPRSLDPEDVVRDTEIEDMMVLEVYMIE